MNDFDNIPSDFDNLERYAPALSRIEKRNCFLVPEGYFDALESHVGGLKALEDYSGPNPFHVPGDYFEQLPEMILQRIRLEEMKIEDESGLPEGYFDQLPGQIMARIRQEERKEVKVISLRERIFSKYTAVAVAASIALLLTWYALTKQGATLSGLPETEFAMMAENPEVFLDESALIEQLATDSVPMQGDIALEASKNEIADYLLENNVDVSSMIKEL